MFSWFVNACRRKVMPVKSPIGERREIELDGAVAEIEPRLDDVRVASQHHRIGAAEDWART